MSLANVGQRLQQLAGQIVHRAASRDELAQERETLRAAPPEPPESMFPPPDPPACRCHDCRTRAQEEQTRRVAHGAWVGRLAVIEGQLFRLSWGTADERDALGTELAKLAGDLVRAGETNRARVWERVIEVDARGREVRAFSTAEVLAEISTTLTALHRRIESMVYMGAADLRQALTTTRNEMVLALARPLETPLEVAEAKAAGLTGPAPSDADKHGLTPGPSANVLEGSTVRFSRRGGR